jgi:short-subunit dehydrogenase
MSTSPRPRSWPFLSALLTGASSGIGEAMAHQLGQAGVPTVVVARRSDRLDDLASRYDGFEVLTADLNDPADLATVAARVQSEAEPIELLVNNAGFGTSGPFQELDPDRLHQEIALNVQALTRLSHAALSVMVPRRKGYLLNVSSMASFQAAPKMAVYAATKAYVTSLTESLHEEVRGAGVHVTALCPGLTKTEFQSVSGGGGHAMSYPGMAWLDVDDVARDGLDAVAAGHATSVPGLFYKGLAMMSGVTPRGVARRMSSLIQRG